MLSLLRTVKKTFVELKESPRTASLPGNPIQSKVSAIPPATRHPTVKSGIAIKLIATENGAQEENQQITIGAVVIKAPRQELKGERSFL